MPGLGKQDALILPNKNAKDLNDGTNRHLRVLRPGQIFDIIDQVHKGDCKHGCVKKMESVIHRQYYGITRSVIETYCKNCYVCQEAQPQTTRPHLTPIIENNFNDRLQIDLIDLRHSKDGEYAYIGHCMDHFTKFHTLFPLKHKSAQEVAEKVKIHYLGYFGPPKKLHTGKFMKINNTNFIIINNKKIQFFFLYIFFFIYIFLYIFKHC